MKRLVVLLGLLLAASSVQAQIGGGGIVGQTATLLYRSSDPAGTCTLRSFLWQTTTNELWICEAGAWVNGFAAIGSVTFPVTNAPGTTTTYNFDLQDAASNTFLSFTNVATPTNTITFAQNSNNPSLTTTVTDGTFSISDSADVGGPTWRKTVGTVSANMQTESTAASWRVLSTGAGATEVSFTLDGSSVPNTFLSFQNVATPANTITLAQDSSVPSLTMTVSGNSDTGKVVLEQRGLRIGAPAFPNGWTNVINNGYALDGTTTASPADTVAVTVVDTTPSIVDGDVQVCGYGDAAAQAAFLKGCVTLDFSGGAATLTTVATFVEVTDIKASSFSVLGGAGDETIAAAFTTGPVSILAAVNLVNSAKTDYTASVPGDGQGEADYNFIPFKCADLQGCDFALTEDGVLYNGHELTIVLAVGTQAVTFVDIDGQMEMAGDANDTLNALDAISFVYANAAGGWVQKSLSEN